ncbi:MAG TPA: PEP/pyruvate-binding domain-containing protein [Candidatus Cloacimonadota bacterium]|nr:PEP/pyruvate-binding domain-containing protein [Candidatus Cloacimonadota bacterium]
MQSLKSKALSENLAVTKPARIELDPEAEWLLECSATHFGIQQRCREFLEEVYHPFVNPELAMNLLRKGVLGDLWYYVQLPESARAQRVLFSCYLHVAQKIKEARQELRLISELLEFMAGLSAQRQADPQLISELLNWMEEGARHQPRHFIRLNGNLRKGLLRLVLSDDLRERVLQLLKSLFLGGLESWRDRCASLDLATGDSFPAEGYWQAQIKTLKRIDQLQDLATLPSFTDIANRLRESVCATCGVTERLHSIFQLLRLEGMEDLRDHLLWDLNRELTGLYRQMPPQQIPGIIDSVYQALESFKDSHLSIVLDCLLSIGKTVISAGDPAHVAHFIQQLNLLPFTGPGEVRIREDWQLDIDKNHIKHIRLCMELIAINPILCKDLLAYLVINVTRYGIFISDEDLFQKDVSALLNADIRPVFIQLKHLLRQFPVFYSEIGAEGEIRDLSTELDELSQRRDRLIHFLRKQVHTESNNTHIGLCASILDYWTDLDPAKLTGLIPPDVRLYLQEGDELLEHQRDAVNAFLKDSGYSVTELLSLSWQSLERAFSGQSEDFGLKRLRLLCGIHLLLKDKYGLDPYDIVKFLTRYKFFDSKEQNRLRVSLVRRDYDSSIRQLLGYIGKLNNIILNPIPSAGWENIFYKRHIAAGIPSMYGSYREPKLEAMGMVFRIENVVRRLFENSLRQINLNYINGKNLRRIVKVLELYDFAMRQEMLTNDAYSSTVAMLDSAKNIANCSLEQYMDIFRLLKDSVNEILSEYYYRCYDPELRRKTTACSRGLDTEIEAEGFYRKLLSMSFMVQGLDVFITNLLETLSQMKRLFKPEDVVRLMSYDPDKLFVHLHGGNSHVENQVALGSKAFFLKRLWHFEYPIPPGFVMTTELYRNREVINTHPDISAEFDELLRQNLAKLERSTRLELGDPQKPLLLSVRSGAPMSLPGAMDTFLNIGLNDQITLLLSQRPNYGWTAWDCYRRLIQSWGMAYGIDRDEFDAVMIHYKQLHNIHQKTQFPAEVMRAMCEDYKAVLAAHSIELEQEPFRQLYRAVSHVLDSWNTDRAKVYRRKLQISDEWGTAVIVQKMVIGNISLESGSGVLFTHAVWHDGPGICLNGDYTICSQGEDVVAGLVHTLPISEEQAKAQARPGELSLETSFPAVYNRLLRLARQLIDDRNFPHQEIEFTFEGPSEDQLFILQTRNQVIRKVPDYLVLCDGASDLTRIGSGIGIGKGAVSGLIVVCQEDITRLKPLGEPLILVRPDTVPDDMELLFECQGLLTARGGVTSHAAVTATRLDLIGIVNCWDLSVDESNSSCQIGSLQLQAGDPITLDASSGSIYQGRQPLKSIHDVF